MENEFLFFSFLDEGQDRVEGGSFGVGQTQICKLVALPLWFLFLFFKFLSPQPTWGFPDGSAIKNLPAMQEPRVLALCWEDPLEKYMAIHSIILAWEILWTEKPGSYSPWGHKKLDMSE